MLYNIISRHAITSITDYNLYAPSWPPRLAVTAVRIVGRATRDVVERDRALYGNTIWRKYLRELNDLHSLTRSLEDGRGWR
ncbi:unnamed protein product, partial [Trichogramma brassicae]